MPKINPKNIRSVQEFTKAEMMGPGGRGLQGRLMTSRPVPSATAEFKQFTINNSEPPPVEKVGLSYDEAKARTEHLVRLKRGGGSQGTPAITDIGNRKVKITAEDMKPIRGTGLIGLAAQAPGLVGRSLDLRNRLKEKGKKPSLGEGMRILLDLPQEWKGRKEDKAI